jgi:hypothetical protein
METAGVSCICGLITLGFFNPNVEFTVNTSYKFCEDHRD